MSEKKIRLLEAGRALHSLEVQIEQYRLHLDELAAQPYEQEKAHAMLNRMSALLESQRTYCNLLKQATSDEDLRVNGARVA